MEIPQVRELEMKVMERTLKAARLVSVLTLWSQVSYFIPVPQISSL
jgi:hypothetical protein